MERRAELTSIFAMTIGLAVLAAQASAQSAAPENPSGLAKQIVVPDAQTGTGAGDTVRETATSRPGQLASNIRAARELLGAAPNPPGRN